MNQPLIPLRFACWALLIGWASLAVGDEAQVQRLQKQYDQSIQPLLVKYCYDCHSGESPDGEMRLDIETRPHQIATTGRKDWQKVRGRVRGHLMPPKDAEQPTAAERQLIATWITQTIESHDCGSATDPGHELIRRLTRYEYKNTVRDLLGVEVKLADDFPMDDVGYGFDNIGDVLTLSPLLMEKYLAAAEEIAAQAIVTEPLEATRRIELTAKQMRVVDGSPRHVGDDWWFFTSQAETEGTWQVKRSAEYLLRVHAYATRGGNEPAKLRLRVDGKDLKTIDILATQAKPEVYETTLKLEAGSRKIRTAFVNDYYEPNHPNPSLRDRNLAVGLLELIGPLGEEGSLEYPESHRLVITATPSEKVSEDAAARQVLSGLAARAFRRPPQPAEIDRLMQLYRFGTERGGNYESGIQMALVGVLCSPNFLFKVELDPPKDDADGIRQLDEFELASRLSYFLWSSMPDEQLFQLARQGKLRQQLEPQIRRMLTDPKASALVESFSVQWLQLRSMDLVEPDRRRFASWNDKLRKDMLTETKMFVAAVLQEDRNLMELIDGDFTFLNERLAKHYGIDGIQGERFQRIALGPLARGGVLTHGSVLTITSNPTRTSPVKRGKWVLENLLGTPPPDPPADVPELVETEKAASDASLRERLEIHRLDVRCAACHEQMDPLGFALENFDAIGAWREKDGRFKIDPAGKLPQGDEFSGPKDLKRILAQKYQDQFLHCLSEKLLTYALGRGVEYYDQCTIDEMVDALKQDGNRFSRLVIEIAKSDAFGKRRGK